MYDPSDPPIPMPGSKKYGRLSRQARVNKRSFSGFSLVRSNLFTRYYGHYDGEYAPPKIRDAHAAEIKGVMKYDKQHTPFGRRKRKFLQDFMNSKHSQKFSSLSIGESVDKNNLNATCGYPMNQWFSDKREFLSNVDWLHF
jgi:hypothetical protein